MPADLGAGLGPGLFSHPLRQTPKNGGCQCPGSSSGSGDQQAPVWDGDRGGTRSPAPLCSRDRHASGCRGYLSQCMLACSSWTYSPVIHNPQSTRMSNWNIHKHCQIDRVDINKSKKPICLFHLYFIFLGGGGGVTQDFSMSQIHFGFIGKHTVFFCGRSP